VPPACQRFRTKTEIAVEEIDRVRAAGARFGTVLADAGYGKSASSVGPSARGDWTWQWG
jgi:SRSO17 transposase